MHHFREAHHPLRSLQHSLILDNKGVMFCHLFSPYLLLSSSYSSRGLCLSLQTRQSCFPCRAYALLGASAYCLLQTPYACLCLTSAWMALPWAACSWITPSKEVTSCFLSQLSIFLFPFSNTSLFFLFLWFHSVLLSPQGGQVLLVAVSRICKTQNKVSRSICESEYEDYEG